MKNQKKKIQKDIGESPMLDIDNYLKFERKRRKFEEKKKGK